MRQSIVTICSACMRMCRSTVREHHRLPLLSRCHNHKARKKSRMSRREISTQISSSERLICRRRMRLQQKAGCRKRVRMRANCSAVNTSPRRRNSVALSKSSSTRMQAISPYTTRQQVHLRSLTLKDHQLSIRASSRAPRDKIGRQKEYQ